MQQNPSRQDWLVRVEALLKGKPFDPDSALGERAEGPRACRSVQAPWKVFARMDHPVALRARQQAEDDLAHGVDGLVLASIECKDALDMLPLHTCAWRNEAGDIGAEQLRLAVSKQPIDPARLEIDFALTDDALVRLVREAGFTGPYKRADGRPYHAQGLDDATELGATLADALAHMRRMDWLDDKALAASVSVTLSASQHMFATLAKVRAARILWAELLKACNLPPSALALHAETSRVMMAETDAHTNILRGVAACFGAGLGGADSISVLPFSASQGLPNSFARRVARNLQSLLLHESELWRVADPAAGAGALERQTDDLCNRAWAVMQACERGQRPPSEPLESAAKPVVGVSKYINPRQDVPEVEALS